MNRMSIRLVALTVIALVGIGVMTVKVIHVHALVGPLAPSLIGFLALMVLAAWKNKTQVYMTVCACVASSTWTMVVIGDSSLVLAESHLCRSGGLCGWPRSGKPQSTIRTVPSRRRGLHSKLYV